MQTDARHFERKSTKLDGHVTSTADPSIELPCEIIDLSAGGAKLKINNAKLLDGEISLKIGDLGPYPADIVWSRPPQMGVKFQASPEVMAEVVMAVALYR